MKSMFKETENIINSFSGEYEFLSNFYFCLNYKDKTTEHTYQAAKAKSRKDRQVILNASTPGKAKKLGKVVSLREDWESVKLGIMKSCLQEKFSDPLLRKKLLATGNATLIEGNTWGDTYWGVCKGKGQNKLGKLLMELRSELRDNAE